MNKEPLDQATNKIGSYGEQLAAKYLADKGYQILCLNYRFRRSEIDIVSQFKNKLVFVEVKLRTNLLYGYPEDFVDQAKVKRIKIGAEHWIFSKNWQGDIRFDIISIVEYKGNTSIEHFEDCF